MNPGAASPSIYSIPEGEWSDSSSGSFHMCRSGRGRLCAPPAHSWKRRKTFSASLCSYESERMSSSFKGLVGGTRLLRSLKWLIPPLVRVFSRPAPLWLFHCLQRRLGNRMQISGQTSRLLFIRSHALTSKLNQRRHELDGAVGHSHDMTVKLNPGRLKGIFCRIPFLVLYPRPVFLEPIYKGAVVKVQPRQNRTPNSTSTTCYIIRQQWFDFSMCALFWLWHLCGLQSAFWKKII